MHTKFIKRALTVALLAFSAGAATIHAQVTFERGMSTPVTFVPKGEWVTGVSVSYAAEKEHNYNFLIVEGIKGRGYTFKISPTVMYAFQDNMTAGGRFNYSRSLVKVDEGSFVLGSDLGYDLDHVYSLSHNYSATGLFRYYISLFGSNRFALFNEVQCTLGGGQSKLASGTGEALSGTYQRNFKLNVGVTPGVMMFLNNYSAMEVNVGVLGFNYTHTKAITDQIYEANVHADRANFKINLFSITFGVMFYL